MSTEECEPFTGPDAWRAWLRYCTLVSRDPEAPTEKRLWASWMTGEILSVRVAKSPDVLRATGS